MKRNKILIVNWGTQSSDYAFSIAKKKNLELFLATGENYPDWIKRYVEYDHIITTNTYDSERLIIDTLVFIEKRGVNFDAITTFFEMNVIQTADLAYAMGFKFLLPSVARRTSGNKLLMKLYCMHNHINIPKFGYFSTPAKGYRELKKVGVPAILKPVKSGHSYGISYIKTLNKPNFLSVLEKSKDQIKASIDEWMNYYNLYKNDFLIEQYIKGDVVSVDGLVQQNKIIFWGITKFEMSPLPHFIQESVTIPADYNTKTKNLCFREAKKIIKVLELDNCAFHSEYKLTKKGPVLLEIAARPPGGNMTLAYKNAYKVDMIDMYLDICLGKKVKVPKISKNNVIIHKSVFDYNWGEVTDISGLMELKKKKYFKLYWHVKKGSTIFPKYDLPSSLVYYQITADNHEEAKKFQDEVNRTFKYTLRKTPKAIYAKLRGIKT